MAVPAQVLRYRGAGAASELARAGTIEFGLGMLRLAFGPPAHPKRAELYISLRNCQRFFVTKTTNPRSGLPLRLMKREADS
jgi:hypothetical protein